MASHGGDIHGVFIGIRPSALPATSITPIRSTCSNSSATRWKIDIPASSIHVDDFFIVCKRPTPAINFLTSAKWLAHFPLRSHLHPTLLDYLRPFLLFFGERWRTGLENPWALQEFFPPLRRSVGPSFLPFNLPSVPPCPIQARPIQSLSSGKIFVYVTKDTSRSAYTWNKVHVPNCN